MMLVLGEQISLCALTGFNQSACVRADGIVRFLLKTSISSQLVHGSNALPSTARRALCNASQNRIMRSPNPFAIETARPSFLAWFCKLFCDLRNWFSQFQIVSLRFACRTDWTQIVCFIESFCDNLSEQSRQSTTLYVVYICLWYISILKVSVQFRQWVQFISTLHMNIYASISYRPSN